MGSYLFKWTHPATEVYVTGTFDDWAKSAKLEKTAAGHFEKLVDLPSSEEKIVYKFVVDDNWITDHTAQTQIDEHGNSNNILLPEHITKKSTGTTGGMSAELPGAFPETPAVTSETQGFSVNPIPATAGAGNPVKLAPGEKVPDPSTLTSNTVESTASMDKESYEKSASGAPVLPNPITPDAERQTGAGLFGLSSDTHNLIPESSIPMGAGAAVVSPEEDTGAAIRGGGGAATTAALAAQVPLEPRGVATTELDNDVAIQGGGGAPTTAALAGEVPLEPHAAATSEVDKDLAIQGGGGAPTTAALAGEIPVEPRGVPQVVQDSQAQAASDARGASTEASANPEAVLEKKSVDQEIEKSTPTAPATSGEQSVGAKVAEIAGGAAAGATAAVAAAAAYASQAKDNVTSDETKEAAKAQVASAQETVGSTAAQAKDSAASAATQAQETATSAASQTQETATSAAAQVQASALAAAAAVKSVLPFSVQRQLDSVLPDSKGTGDEPPSATVPEPVKESIAESNQPAEAAVNPTQVSNKAAVEQELKEEVKPAESSGDPAPTTTAATTATAPVSVNKSTEAPLAAGAAGGLAGAAAGVAVGKSTETPLPAVKVDSGLNASATSPSTTTAANPKLQDSRDVSPMTRTEGQTQPIATSGLVTSSVPKSSGPDVATPSATSTAAVTSLPTAVSSSAGKDAVPGASTNVSNTNPAVSAAKQAVLSPVEVPPASPASTRTGESANKSKRRSIFGRIKDKIHHKRSDSKSES